jgi:hypothetical protein
MVAYLDNLFTFFRPAFARHATYTWFVAITIAVMLRTEAPFPSLYRLLI